MIVTRKCLGRAHIIYNGNEIDGFVILRFEDIIEFHVDDFELWDVFSFDSLDLAYLKIRQDNFRLVSRLRVRFNYFVHDDD